MPTGTLQIINISGHSGSVPGRGMQREEEVCKYIDVTTCIGCKACEVACVEWNDMPFRQTTFDNTYQTMPRTEWNYWNLIKFNEHQREDGTLMWLMRKDQCMHCEDPGCLRACPSDGAIVQYANGIVDFQQENCIGCQYLRVGLPVRHPAVQRDDEEGVQVHPLLGPRGAGARARVHQVVPDWLSALRHARRRCSNGHRRARGNCGSNPVFPNAGVYDPPGVGGTHVIYVLHDVTKPELYGGLPSNPTIPASFTVWKRFAKPIGLLVALFAAPVAFFHYVTEGPKRAQPDGPEREVPR